MNREQVDKARAYCFNCRVQQHCLVESQLLDERFGIWGGYTPEERRRAREHTASLDAMLDLYDNGELYGLVVKL